MLTIDQRIDIAKEKTRRLVSHTQELLALHEGNAIVTYSPALSSQIPTSHAANAFNLFQRALHAFEFIRLCAIWDKADPDTDSIPAIIKLIDDKQIIERLAEETRSYWTNFNGVLFDTGSDPALRKIEIEALRKNEADFGEHQAIQIEGALTSAIMDTTKILSSPQLESVRNHRDKYLAHALSITRTEKKKVVAPAKYGMERDLLNLTLPIVQNLYLGINGTSFDFADARADDKRCAEALWGSCKFDIKY